MLHTRTEPSENERHHDQAEEEKWNIFLRLFINKVAI